MCRFRRRSSPSSGPPVLGDLARPIGSDDGFAGRSRIDEHANQLYVAIRWKWHPRLPDLPPRARGIALLGRRRDGLDSRLVDSTACQLAAGVIADLRHVFSPDLRSWASGRIAMIVVEQAAQARAAPDSPVGARVLRLARRRRIDAVLLEHPLDCAAPNFKTKVLERTADPRVAPPRVSRRHFHDQPHDLARAAPSADSGRARWSLRLMGALYASISRL